MQLLKLPEVLKKVPVSKTTWYAMVKSGEAPAAYKLGPRSVAWSEDQINDWIRKRQPAANDLTALQS
ncbi:helix-turn-helix transcriptional regulator [Arsukibacterium indicum]|uniref:AlpA family phage regulatory protein n=1 Tax=Arsukibacterium indicum TaxID=2848612 RepID=A0ABS6MGN2_9GAMM|nr:AlpA family phage regulatory protein [Arsukibacterium indicum]MBV2127968.1 AlpA family phage regulatory protein [Arsukibacterium indicum]